jgi:hypothetical protein
MATGITSAAFSLARLLAAGSVDFRGTSENEAGGNLLSALAGEAVVMKSKDWTKSDRNGTARKRDHMGVTNANINKSCDHHEKHDR